MSSYKVIHPNGCRLFFSIERAKIFWFATKNANMYYKNVGQGWRIHPWYRDLN